MQPLLDPLFKKKKADEKITLMELMERIENEHGSSDRDGSAYMRHPILLARIKKVDKSTVDKNTATILLELERALIRRSDPKYCYKAKQLDIIEKYLESKKIL